MKKKHGKSYERVYRIWIAMKQRCRNPNNEQFKYYGLRNIKVCEEWEIFQSFYEWSYNNGYSENLEIDRIDNNGNYEPSNCQWITHKENMEAGKRRMPKNNTSDFVGVHFDKSRNKWLSYICHNKKFKNLGRYDELEDAINARINSEINLFGEQRTNFYFPLKYIEEDLNEIGNFADELGMTKEKFMKEAINEKIGRMKNEESDI